MDFTSLLLPKLQFKAHSTNISKVVLPREQTGIVLHLFISCSERQQSSGLLVEMLQRLGIRKAFKLT